MKYTSLPIDVNLRPEGLVVDVDSLFAALAGLHDRRDARGLCYSLVTVLVFVVLAKLQVFRLERRFRRIGDGKLSEETTYGATSLTALEATPERLLYLIRTHWGIESGLRYRRDETLREDRCCLKGQGARAMAVINNLALGLLRNRSPWYIPDARRYYAANLDEAVALVLRSPAPS